MEKKIYSVYILHSSILQKYYVGMTSLSAQERLTKHLSNHSGFTSKTKDWTIIKTIELDSKSIALKLEKQIKNRGIQRWLDSH